MAVTVFEGNTVRAELHWIAMLTRRRLPLLLC
jgi:hypothetical protein